MRFNNTDGRSIKTGGFSCNSEAAGEERREIKNALWQNYLKSVKEECEVVIECCLSSTVTHSPMKCGRGGGKIWKNISPKCSRSGEERREEETNEIFL